MKKFVRGIKISQFQSVLLSIITGLIISVAFYYAFDYIFETHPDYFKGSRIEDVIVQQWFITVLLGVIALAISYILVFHRMEKVEEVIKEKSPVNIPNQTLQLKPDNSRRRR